MILQLQSTVRNSILTPPLGVLSTAHRQCAKSTVRLPTLTPPYAALSIFFKGKPGGPPTNNSNDPPTTVDSPQFDIDPPSLRTVDGPSTLRQIDKTTPYLK